MPPFPSSLPLWPSPVRCEGQNVHTWKGASLFSPSFSRKPKAEMASPEDKTVSTVHGATFLEPLRSLQFFPTPISFQHCPLPTYFFFINSPIDYFAQAAERTTRPPQPHILMPPFSSSSPPLLWPTKGPHPWKGQIYYSSRPFFLIFPQTKSGNGQPNGRPSAAEGQLSRPTTVPPHPRTTQKKISKLNLQICSIQFLPQFFTPINSIQHIVLDFFFFSPHSLI